MHDNDISEQLIIECCNAIEQRRRNGGDWQGGKGPPYCILEICRIKRWDGLQKIMIAESFISSAAIQLVAEQLGHMPTE